MPFIKRRFTPCERAERLRLAAELRASGVNIQVPAEWRDNCYALDLEVAPPGDCVVWDRPSGQAYYAVYLRACATQSGVRYPEFDIETAWDDQIVLASFDETKTYVEFGGQTYRLEEVLNPRIEDNKKFTGGQIVFGSVLATGLRRIPPEHGDGAIVPFDLVLRDHCSGEEIRRIQARFSILRSGQPERPTAERTGYAQTSSCRSTVQPRDVKEADQLGYD
jgi:hypothetical protein